MTTTKTYESDGSDGYSAGTYGYRVDDDRGTWTDGGFESRELARQAARKIVRREAREVRKPAYLPE